MRSLTRNIHTFKFMYLSIRHYFVVFVSKHRCTFAFLMMIFTRNEKTNIPNCTFVNAIMWYCLSNLYASIRANQKGKIYLISKSRSIETLFMNYGWITTGVFFLYSQKKQPKICTYVCPEAKCIRQESLQKWMAFSSSTKLISESEKNRWYFRMQNYLINLISLRKFINMLNTFFRISLYFQHKEKHFFTG